MKVFSWLGIEESALFLRVWWVGKHKVEIYF
jgi:hypothetical protein